MTWLFPFLTPDKINWGALETHFSETIESMRKCPQDATFHMEGDVWTHTKMVMEEMYALPQFKEASPEEQSVLMAACFFHDIAKPIDTVQETNSITSKKHASHGARKVRELLWNSSRGEYIKCPWHIRELIANMVMLHCLPSFFIEKDDPLHSVAGASYVLKNKLLYLLSLSDNKGRICSDITSSKNSMDMLSLYKDFCEEHLCFEQPLPFISDKTRFKFFFHNHSLVDYEIFENFKGTAYLMSGIPGSGKDFTINKSYSHLPSISLDNIRKSMGVGFGEKEGEVIQEAKEMCRKSMRNGQDFVLNATNTSRSTRAKWIRLFRQYGYKIIIHYIEKPMLTTLNNNKNREAIVPEDVIINKFYNIDIPTLLECHELKIDIQDNIN